MKNKSTPIFNRSFYKTYIAVGSLLLVTVIFFTALVYARENGITGQTGPSNGCTCHTTDPTTSTTVSASSQSGSFTVTAGSTSTFTITVANSTAAAAGVDIAVKTTQSGETNAGTLAPESGSGLQALNSELTHTQPKAMSNGQASFTFTWTAPSTPGTYYLRAAGNAVNYNGQNDAGDQWNRMNTQTLTVEAAPEVAVTSPNGGEAWCAGSSHNITWTASNVSNVKIELSSDAGQTFPVQLAASIQASLGSWSWNIPANQPDGPQYRVRVSDVSNASTNDVSNGNFSISSGVSITAQPQAQTACQGQPVSLTVAASGGGLSYQWRLNGTNINGATQATYSIPAAAPANEGNYDVIVSGACGSPVTSSQVSLTVNLIPAITSQPTAREACVGTQTVFTVAATGAGITYQWRKEQQPIANATGSTYTIDNVSVGDAGNYDVVVSGSCTPPATSAPAKLTVTLPPAIVGQPQPVTACAGSTAQLKVKASGSNLSFQWRKDGLPITGAKDSILNFDNITGITAGNYDVIVSGSCTPEVTSDPVTFTVAAPVSISQQPLSQTVLAGTNAELSVKATGTAIAYQWRKNGDPLAGKTQSTLAFTNLTLADAGAYDVLLMNTCGTVTSTPAVLTVITSSGGPVLMTMVSSVDFGMVRLGIQKDTTITAAVKNLGDAVLIIQSASIIGSDASSFALLDNIDNLSLDPLASTNLRIRFAPTTGGLKTAQIDFTSNSQVNPPILLSGTGGFVAVTASTDPLDFGTVKVGSDKDLSFGLQNTGNIAAVITSMTITGAQAGDFQVLAPIAPSGIDPGQTQQASVRYTPVNSGPSEAELRIQLENIAQPVVVRLRGNGTTPVMENNESTALKLSVFPNPAADRLSISFEPDKSGSIEISVIDVFGNTVKTFSLGAESSTLNWDATDNSGKQLPSGVYIVLLKSARSAVSAPVSINR